MRQGIAVPRQLAILRARGPLIVVAVILAAALAYLVSGVLPRVYEGRATLLVGQALAPDAPDLDQLLASQRLTQTYAEMVTMRPMLEQVIDELDLPTTPEQLGQRVTSQSGAGSLFLAITVQDPDPVVAATIANRFAEALVEASPSVLLDPAASGRTNLLRVVEPAIPPTSFVSPRTLMNTLLVAIITLIVAVGLAFILEYLDDRLRSPAALRDAAPDVPVLGTIIAEDPATAGPQPTILTRPASAMAAAYQAIRTQLGFARPGVDLRSLLVVGERADIGSAEVAANLAIAFAQAGSRTVVVDADLHDPRLHELFRQPNDVGLMALLSDETVTPRQVGRPSPTVRGLIVIPVGATPAMAGQLLQPDQLRRVLAALESEVDVVIVRGPSLPDAGGAAVLAAATDGVLLVIQGRHTTHQTLASIRESFRLSGANVVGFAYVEAVDTVGRVRAWVRATFQPSPRRRESS